MVTRMIISAPQAGDETGWRRLWADYCSRYDIVLTPEVLATVWRRLTSLDARTRGLIARDPSGEVIGFCHYVLHDHTWSVAPLCYLSDMYVAPEYRRQGIARALLSRLTGLARENGWPRVYWHTRIENLPARRLYDSITGGADAMVRYTVRLER